MKRIRTLTVLIALVVAGAAVAQVAAVPAATTQQEAPDEAGTSFSVESLTAPESVAPGSNVTVAAQISNEGEAGTEEVEFRVGGAVVDRQLVSLEAGESASVQFSANTEGLEGEVRHGVFTASDGQIAELTISESFTLTSLDAPENATAGDEITVEAGVQNPNDFETQQDVTFRLAGAAVASESVELGGGEESTVTFNVSTEGVEAGTYVHSVFTRDDGQFAEIEITAAENETEEPAENETAPENASVSFEDQESDGTTVTVDSVTLPSEGYVVIHDSSLLDGNVVGSVIGVSEFLEAGENEDVTVELFDVPGAEFNESALTEDQTLIAMPHQETTNNTTYDFVSTNGSADGPFVTTNEANETVAVTDAANVTIEAAEEPEENETEEPAPNETEEPAPNETEEPAPNETEEPAPNETEEPAPNETEEPAAEETETRGPNAPLPDNDTEEQ